MAFKTGDTITERYRVLAALGGENGRERYLAEDPAGRRLVVLVVLPALLVVDPVRRTRFFSDVQALASFAYPTVLNIRDYGEANTAPYLVYPFPACGSLAGLLDGRPLDPAWTIRVLRPIAEALDAAHASGLLHGDLRPDTVWFADADTVAVSEVGVASIARAGQVRPSSGLSLDIGAETANEDAPYTAPEAARGEVLDGRVDVYAFGVLAHHMLIGRPPGADGADLSLGIARETIAAAIAVDRWQRPTSAGEVLAELAEVLLDGALPAGRVPTVAPVEVGATFAPITAGRGGLVGRGGVAAVLPTGRRRIAVAAIALLFLALVAGGAWALLRPKAAAPGSPGAAPTATVVPLATPTLTPVPTGTAILPSPTPRASSTPTPRATATSVPTATATVPPTATAAPTATTAPTATATPRPVVAPNGSPTPAATGGSPTPAATGGSPTPAATGGSPTPAAAATPVHRTAAVPGAPRALGEWLAAVRPGGAGQEVVLLRTDGSVAGLAGTAEEVRDPAFSSDGASMAYAARSGQVWSIVVVDPRGTRTVARSSSSVTDFGSPAWAGGTVLFTATDIRGYGIFSVPADGSAPFRRVSDPLVGDAVAPAPAPDGSSILFLRSERPGAGWNLWRMGSQGGNEELVATLGLPYAEPRLVWGTDGATAVLVGGRDAASAGVVVVDLRTGTATPLPNANPATGATIAPDGTTIVYRTTRSGRPALVAVGRDGAVRFTLDGDFRAPAWAPAP